MDAQGLGRTHPLTPTRRLKQHTHAYNPRTCIAQSPPAPYGAGGLAAGAAMVAGEGFEPSTSGL